MRWQSATNVANTTGSCSTHTEGLCILRSLSNRAGVLSKLLSTLTPRHGLRPSHSETKQTVHGGLVQFEVTVYQVLSKLLSTLTLRLHSSHGEIRRTVWQHGQRQWQRHSGLVNCVFNCSSQPASQPAMHLTHHASQGATLAGRRNTLKNSIQEPSKTTSYKIYIRAITGSALHAHVMDGISLFSGKSKGRRVVQKQAAEKEVLARDATTDAVLNTEDAGSNETHSVMDAARDCEAQEPESFGQLGLNEWLEKVCTSLGMRRPTEVQRGCIPAILACRNVIGVAHTGSGKTAAFALPILQKLAKDPYGVFALVLTPTRCGAVRHEHTCTTGAACCLSSITTWGTERVPLCLSKLGLGVPCQARYLVLGCWRRQGRPALRR